jgi:hypothetical protein
MKKAYLKNVGMVSTWKNKKRKTSIFVDAGSNNWNKGKENKQHGMNRQGRMEKEIKL